MNQSHNFEQDPPPRYYVCRNNHEYVPMIAVDELPHGIRLRYVPERITAAQAHDMIWIANEDFRGRHALDSTSDAYLFNLSNNASTERPITPTVEPSVHDDPAVSTTSTTQQPFSTFSIAGRPPPPSGVQPNEGRKKLCTHWIRTGECDYTQQGCRYKHVMPTTAEGLAEVGFHTIPRWWQEKLEEERRWMYPEPPTAAATTPARISHLYDRRARHAKQRQSGHGTDSRASASRVKNNRDQSQQSYRNDHNATDNRDRGLPEQEPNLIDLGQTPPRDLPPRQASPFYSHAPDYSPPMTYYDNTSGSPVVEQHQPHTSNHFDGGYGPGTGYMSPSRYHKKRFVDDDRADQDTRADVHEDRMPKVPKLTGSNTTNLSAPPTSHKYTDVRLESSMSQSRHAESQRDSSSMLGSHNVKKPFKPDGRARPQNQYGNKQGYRRPYNHGPRQYRYWNDKNAKNRKSGPGKGNNTQNKHIKPLGVPSNTSGAD